MMILTVRATAMICGLALSAFVGLASPAEAQSRPAPSRSAISGRIDIPAGDLGAALRTLALRTGTNILYSSRLVDGLRSRPVRGATSVSGALTQMLQGSGLSFAVQRDGSISISRRNAVTAAPGSADQPIVEPERVADRLEDVVVLGRYAESLSVATSVKRNADVILDSLSSADIGDFPARNVGDALARVPGVSVDRIGPGGRGESLSINLRGLPANFQTVLMNGREIAVSENVETSQQIGRSFRYDILPPDLISRLDVIKTTTASMTESGIAGTVDILTYRPLDLGPTTVMSQEVLHNQLADRSGLSAGALISWVNADETLGVLVSGFYADRRERFDSDFSDGWVLGRNSSFAANRVALADVYIPLSRRPTVETYRKRRTTGTLAVQYRPNDDWETRLDAFYTHQNSPYRSAGIAFAVQVFV